jgi:hypothetical protein
VDLLTLALTGAAPQDSLGTGLADSSGPGGWPAALEGHPRTAAFRRLARTAGPDLVSAARDRPLSAFETLADVPRPRLGGISEAAQANAATALAAAGRGDRSEALARLGDNLVVAGRLLASSDLIANLTGLRMLQRTALLPLAVVEERDGNGAQALALRDAARRLDGVSFPLRGTGGLAVDPADPSLWKRVLATPAAPPGYRAELLGAAWAGLCGNRWELLGGPSRARRETFLALADSIADLPEAPVLVELIHRTWRGLEPREVAVERRRRSRIQWTPWMVAHRLSLCAAAQ